MLKCEVEVGEFVSKRDVIGLMKGGGVDERN